MLAFPTKRRRMSRIQSVLPKFETVYALHLISFSFLSGLTEDDAFRHFSLSLYGSVSNSKYLVLTLSFPSRYISSPLLIFPQSHLELGAFLVLRCSAISMLICWSAAPDAIRGSSSKSDFGEKEKSLKSSHRH